MSQVKLSHSDQREVKEMHVNADYKEKISRLVEKLSQSLQMDIEADTKLASEHRRWQARSS